MSGGSASRLRAAPRNIAFRIETTLMRTWNGLLRPELA
jgi:hypothetical protein